MLEELKFLLKLQGKSKGKYELTSSKKSSSHSKKLQFTCRNFGEVTNIIFGVYEIPYVFPRNYTVASSIMQMQQIRRLDSMNCTNNMINIIFSVAVIFLMFTVLSTGLGLKQLLYNSNKTRWVLRGILGHTKIYRSNAISRISLMRRSRNWQFPFAPQLNWHGSYMNTWERKLLQSVSRNMYVLTRQENLIQNYRHQQ